MSDESTKPGKFENVSQEAYEKAQMKWFEQQKKNADADGQDSSDIPDDPANASAKNPVTGGPISKKDQEGRKK